MGWLAAVGARAGQGKGQTIAIQGPVFMNFLSRQRDDAMTLLTEPDSIPWQDVSPFARTHRKCVHAHACLEAQSTSGAPKASSRPAVAPLPPAGPKG